MNRPKQLVQYYRLMKNVLEGKWKFCPPAKAQFHASVKSDGYEHSFYAEYK